jgi:hypothetical protein
MSSPISIIPTEPLFVGERFIRVLFYIAPRNPGDPQTIIGTLTLMPGEENIVLDAIKGEKGDKGDPAPFWRPEWNSTITIVDDLPTGLGDADAGRAWYINGYWHIWTGEGWRVELGAIPGPPGPTPNMHIIARGVEPPAGAITYPLELNVAEGGTDLEPVFTVDVPIIPGPEGPQANILDAPDLFGFPAEGQTFTYAADADGEGTPGVKWGDPSPWAAKMFSVPESSFGPAGNLGAAWNIVATLIIPGQAQAYYPSFDGHLRWSRSGLFNSAQVEVQVRSLIQGSADAAETGSLCARALYDPSTLDAETIAHIREHWSDAGNPARSISPDTSVGRVPAGEARVYYVLIARVGGSGNVAYAVAGSHLSCKLFPVS